METDRIVLHCTALRRTAEYCTVLYFMLFTSTKNELPFYKLLVIFWLELARVERAAMYDHVFFGNALCVVDPVFLEMHFGTKSAALWGQMGSNLWGQICGPVGPNLRHEKSRKWLKKLVTKSHARIFRDTLFKHGLKKWESRKVTESHEKSRKVTESQKIYMQMKGQT